MSDRRICPWVVGSLATFLNSLFGTDDWTAYQTVAKPDERKIWWRIPTLDPWQEIDLKKYLPN